MTVFPLSDAMQQKNNMFSPLELGHPKKRNGVLHVYFSLEQLPPCLIEGDVSVLWDYAGKILSHGSGHV